MELIVSHGYFLTFLYMEKRKIVPQFQTLCCKLQQFIGKLHLVNTLMCDHTSWGGLHFFVIILILFYLEKGTGYINQHSNKCRCTLVSLH